MIERLKKFVHLPSKKVEVQFFIEKEYSLFDYAWEDHSGQYLVRYHNGMFEVIDGEMSGFELKRQLGYKALKIQYWAMLPEKFCPTAIDTFGHGYVTKFLLKRDFFPYEFIKSHKSSERAE